jgi:hypothetical protein
MIATSAPILKRLSPQPAAPTIAAVQTGASSSHLRAGNRYRPITASTSSG